MNKAKQSFCPEHPRYRAKGQPRSACCLCWTMWSRCGPVANVLKKFKAAVLRESK